MSDLVWGVFVSIFLVGGVVGGLAGGHIGQVLSRILSLWQMYGLKRTLLWNNVFFLSGGIGLYMSQNTISLCISRFIVGLGAGISTVVVPVYINQA